VKAHVDSLSGIARQLLAESAPTTVSDTNAALSEAAAL
jgi:hypothetical protein